MSVFVIRIINFSSSESFACGFELIEKLCDCRESTIVSSAE